MRFAASLAPCFRTGWARLLLLLLAFTVTDAVCAQDRQTCDEQTIAAVASQLGRPDLRVPVKSDNSDAAPAKALIAAACKHWPENPALIAITMAYLPPHASAESAEPGNRTDQWLVALLDTASGTLRQRYDGQIEEDAVTEVDEQSLWLDTARYRFAPDVRGFGVVFHSAAHGPNCADGGFEDELTLFAPVGASLHPVLDTYLHLWNAFSSDEDSCTPERAESAALSFSMGAGSSHGYADLVVSAKVESDGPAGGKSVKKTVRKTLHYDGKTYPLEQISSFWSDSK